MIVDTSWARLQANTYTCGPCALRHALRCYGVRASVRRLADLAGIHRDFEDDTTPGLERAAATYGFRLQHVCRDHPMIARLALEARSTDAPVLVCVDRWGHWVTVTGTTSRQVTYLDSERPGPVERRESWRAFLSRAVMWNPGETRFDFYPLVRA